LQFQQPAAGEELAGVGQVDGNLDGWFCGGHVAFPGGLDFGFDGRGQVADNSLMEISGHVENGVVVLDDSVTLLPCGRPSDIARPVW
jgi:hypothetical protein